MQNRSWNVFIISICAIIVILIGYQLVKFYSRKAPALPIFGMVPEFALTSQEKLPVTKDSFKGKVVIADFIFTECAGPCPMMTAQMSGFQKSLANDPDIKLLSFSVDPETDTPTVLAQYGEKFGAKNDKWTFLTGDKASVYNLTRSGFHLTIDADSNAIAHSTKFVLIDKNSMIRGYYDSCDETSAERLLSDARTLVKE